MKRIESDTQVVKVEYKGKTYRRFHFIKKWQELGLWYWRDMTEEAQKKLEDIWQYGE